MVAVLENWQSKILTGAWEPTQKAEVAVVLESVKLERLEEMRLELEGADLFSSERPQETWEKLRCLNLEAEHPHPSRRCPVAVVLRFSDVPAKMDECWQEELLESILDP